MSDHTPVRVPHILHVEDNPGDVHLVREALSRAGLSFDLTVARTGEEALEALREAGSGGRRRPDLALLDLNLPGMSGHEVLDAIRRDPVFAMLPVVVLSSSDREIDIEASYRHGANSYVIKPLDVDTFIDRVVSIHRFW